MVLDVLWVQPGLALMLGAPAVPCTEGGQKFFYFPSVFMAARDPLLLGSGVPCRGRLTFPHCSPDSVEENGQAWQLRQCLMPILLFVSNEGP